MGLLDHQKCLRALHNRHPGPLGSVVRGTLAQEAGPQSPEEDDRLHGAAHHVCV